MTRTVKLGIYGVVALVGLVGLAVFPTRWATLGAGTTLLACFGMACALYVGARGIRRLLRGEDHGGIRQALRGDG